MTSMKHHRFAVQSPNGTRFDVVFRENTRAKRLILRLDPKSGKAVVTAPSYRDFNAAKKFVASRTDWLEAQAVRLPTRQSVEPGGSILFRGERHLLTRSADKGRTKLIEGSPNEIDSPGALITFEDRILSFCKKSARKDLEVAVDRYAAILRASPQKITLRDTVSRWGSCSARGNLSFSWRLILAPPYVLDYVAAHEVAHLIEMNHSSAFWKLVDDAYGPHKAARQWLKSNGRQLHSLGSGGLLGG
ncbi:M48 family metallopeptidase [Ponticaulis profundi]|uniref:M48 family metallopeptidase n=1 Tax=Ponticaulis profundi TaxID=2665222 RepID=A0ABW1SAA0_9PROT